MENNTWNQKFVGLNKRPLVLYSLTSFTFILILFRLIFLQLLNHETYKKMSDENRVRLIATQPIRGRIKDTNGVILADSKLKYDLIIKPQYVNVSDWQKYKSKLSFLLDIPSDQLQKTYFHGLKNHKFSIVLINDLTIEQLIKFKENENIFYGLEIATKLIRNYPFKTLASHVIGYTQPITDWEFNALSKKGYKLNDLIGRTGIEFAYEELIRGEWG